MYFDEPNAVLIREEHESIESHQPPPYNMTRKNKIFKKTTQKREKTIWPCLVYQTRHKIKLQISWDHISGV